MGSITVRKIEEELKKKLRLRAARHGRSMEDEVRTILRHALTRDDDGETDLGSAIHRRFARLGSVELKLPARGPMRPLPRFDK